MYHISEDIRAQKSAKRICDALIACAKYKPFDEITVADLHKEHLISRTTFYRLFDNTVDVLEFCCDQMGRSILLNIRGTTPKELTINAITALRERRELIELLSRSGHLDIFQKVGEKYIPLSILTKELNLEFGSEYFYRILSQIIPTAIDVWVKGGQKDSPEDVYEKLYKSIKTLGQIFE